DVAVALACYGAGSMAVALTAPAVLDRIPDRTFMRAGAVLLSAGLAGAFALLAIPGTCSAAPTPTSPSPLPATAPVPWPWR
ncbi:MAG: hypothetical protein ABIP92_00460, partial [Arthrobacter sp.]